MNKKKLTIEHAQKHQPWTQPYATGVNKAKYSWVPHILGSHCVLHVSKSVGKLAAVFEALDHPALEYQANPDAGCRALGAYKPTEAQLQTIKDMAADLMTAALRFANLYGFDLATELERRVLEKNGSGYPLDE